jgi:hypothetical protein
MSVQNPGDLALLITIGAAILAGLLWLIKAQTAISKEFQRNGGSSTKDALYRIERDIVQIRERLDNHIDTHNHGGKA